METKQCSKCSEVKAVSEFHKRASAKDGLAYQCKQCKNMARMDYHNSNRERILSENKDK